MNNLRIALMPSAYAPAVGGVEVLTARLAHHLLARRHAVEVWAPRHEDDDLPAREVIEGVTVRRFVFAMPRADLFTLARTPIRATRTLRELKVAVANFQPTHMHVQCFSGNGAYATLLSRSTGVPLVVTLQGETVMDDHDIYERSTTLRIALRWGLRHARRVTGCSQFTLDDAQSRFGLDPAKSSVIFNGVDLHETVPALVDLPFQRYVLGLGRVVQKKGFDLLISAFGQLAQQHSDVGLVIAGAGPELGRLRAQVELSGLQDRVHFPGSLTRERVASVMAGAEMFVMPSRVEPFGIVVLEAWAAHVPVVVSAHGGAPEFVRDRCDGVVVNPDNPSALAEAINGLLRSPTERERLASNADGTLPRFSWPRVTAQYESIYLADRSELVA